MLIPILYGICLDLVWIWFGFGLDLVWIWFGFDPNFITLNKKTFFSMV